MDADTLKMSCEKRRLRHRIRDEKNADEVSILKQQRNKFSHMIRQHACANAASHLDEKAREIENQKDGAQMFHAVHLLQRKKQSPIVVNDASGKLVLRPMESASIIRNHFSAAFADSTCAPLHQEKKPLGIPISEVEVRSAARRLNNGRAIGPDDLPAELIKYGPAPLHRHLADLYTRAINCDDQLSGGHLVPLQKPGKPKCPPSNLRPIVLLTALRKVLSIIALNRIRHAVNTFLSPNQSGFRSGRSTADVVWSYRWIAARCQRVKESFGVLGIDMSKAFDTISRHRLLTILASFLENDEVTNISYLLRNTSLEVRLPGGKSEQFQTNRGTPQGDSLSPVLFVIYLEAVLREVRQIICARPDLGLPTGTEYADDVDFLSSDCKRIQELLPDIAKCLKTWDLNINESKTELTNITRLNDRVCEEWRLTRKLGSLIGDHEDAARRMQLATAALHWLWALWVRGSIVNEWLRVRLYKAYRSCATTTGLGASLAPLVDAFHRQQLWKVIRIRYPAKIKNNTLYKRTNSTPLGISILGARWCLFRHVLRLDQSALANLSMCSYFKPSTEPTWRGRPRTTLPVVLRPDLELVGRTLKTSADSEELRSIAQNRGAWSYLSSHILERYVAAHR